MSSPESQPNESESQKSESDSASEFQSESRKSGSESRPESDLAWAAGFLDGEGCIHIAKQRYPGRRSDTYRLGVHVAQNDLPTLEALCVAVGIRAPIYATKRAKNHSRQCYTLNFSGHSALLLLQAVMQHLRRKRLEAETALKFWVEGRMGIPGRGKRVDPDLAATREHYFVLMKQLK